MAREKKYGTRVPLTINVDNDDLRAFREMCHRDRVSMSERFNEFMREEVKKAEGLNATPIAIAYVKTSHSNTQQSSLSVFRDFDTVKSVYKKLQSEQITLDAWNELDRYQKNFKAGLMAYKSNIIQR